MNNKKLIFHNRHTETDMNIKDITMGQLKVETDFSDNGYEQISAIGLYLSIKWQNKRQISIIFTYLSFYILNLEKSRNIK